MVFRGHRRGHPDRLQLSVAGATLKKFKILNICIFIAFLISGLTLETRNILEEIRNVKTVAVAMVSTFVLFPLTGYLLAKLLFPGNADFVVGVCIIAVAPVTVASGTVMTQMARGNIPLSLFICVASNFLCLLSIPLSLKLLLAYESAIHLPILQMIQQLFVIILIPILLGQLLRGKLMPILTPYKKLFSIFSQFIVLMFILNALSSSVTRVSQMGFRLILIFLFLILFHSFILFLNSRLARLLKLDRASTSAFTIHTSQKTLTVSYVVWADYFAAAFPMALIPGIGYHLTQSVMDSVIADRLRERADRAERDHTE